MSTFDIAFTKTIGHEGGFQKIHSDRGNWTSGVVGVGVLKGTKYGISAMAYPDEDIQNLTPDRAKELYKRDYWDKLRLNEIDDPNISIDLFDIAVNTGIGTAGKMFQKALNLTNRQATHYNNIPVDGKIGQGTIEAYNANKDKRILFNVLNIIQGAHYVALMEANEAHEKWIGWFERVELIKR